MAEIKEFEKRMIKTTEVLAAQFAAVRAGRANAAVLDRITIDYYGTETPIQQVATISTPDPRTLAIQPWDGSTVKLIEKAIQQSDLGINPQNDGRVLRLVFPQLTEERRKDLIKQVKKYGEEAKVAVRNIRRDAMDKFKKQQKASEITEDDYKNMEKDMQKETDSFIKKVDELCAKKEKELSIKDYLIRSPYWRTAEIPFMSHHSFIQCSLGETQSFERPPSKSTSK